MINYVLYCIQSIVLILLTPLFMGFIKSFKAFLRGYKGPGVLQTYYDLSRLYRKGKVVSKSSSFITTIGPSISLSAAIMALFLVPIFYISTQINLGNIFIVVFFISIIKFTNSLMGLDCASTFGGMGASRELFISMFGEPIIFVLITFLYFETRYFNISKIAFMNINLRGYSVAHIIAAVAFFILILIENSRMPVDNPETHLELTMIHEAMILDISGRDLAFVELASGIKMMIFLAIFINAFVPLGAATVISASALIIAFVTFMVKITLCLVVISLVETMMAKFRLFRVPELAAAAFSIGIVAITINYFI